MVDRAGQLIGNYRLERHIASGGMADIYLARHTYLQRQVAVKILRSGMQEREQSAFVQEARLIAKLEHPHIIPIYDFGIDNTTTPSFAYLIMEYATGSLENRYPPGMRVPFATIRSHVADVASALYYAHERGIIHRDVKPQNILVSGSGNILLSDFGIATLQLHANHNERTIDELTIAGTPTFMAPEQISLGRSAFTPAIDQYALGIVVYQWLCGYPPFMDSNMTRLLVKQLHDQPPSLLPRVPLLPTVVEEVVFKALAKEPEARFPSVIAFSQALDAAFESVFRSHIPQPPAQSDTSYLPTGPLTLSPAPTRPVQNTQEVSAYIPAPTPTTEQPESFPFHTIPTQEPTWGLTLPPSYQQQEEASFTTSNPWTFGQQQQENTDYQGPPTITGYAPPQLETAKPDNALGYLPPAPGALPSLQQTRRLHPLLHFFTTSLIVLVTPFAFVGRAVVRLVQQPTGQQRQGITSFDTIAAYGPTTTFPGSTATATARKNFFIAYHRKDEHDRQWAGWIAWYLEQSGFTVIHPDWDFQAGTNFDMEITRASSSAERVIIILSPAYFSTHDSLRKLKRDLSGKQDTVIPVIVHPFNDAFNHPLKDLVAINLAGLDEQTAQARLLSAVRKERQKPMSPPVFPSAFPAQTPWGQPAQSSWGQPLQPQPAWGQPVQSSWGQPTPVNTPANPWLPPTTTQPVVGSGASTMIVPAASLIQQINDRRNQSADDANMTVILPASAFAALFAAQRSQVSNFNQENTLIGGPPPSGGKQMSIEQDALKVTEFLKALQDMVITDPEFGKLYTDAGRMDDQITKLSTALKTNLQLLQEARQDVQLNPNMRQYQESVTSYLQGLSAATSSVERMWKTFRASTLTQINDVTQKVEQESKLLQEGQAQAIALQAGSANGSGADGSILSQEKAQRSSWIKKASDGLSQFTSFLTLATDIDKAVTQWSPVLFETFKHSLDLLSQLHLF